MNMDKLVLKYGTTTISLTLRHYASNWKDKETADSIRKMADDLQSALSEYCSRGREVA